MKFQRKKIAVALAYALGAGSTLLIAAPSQAADISVSVTGTNIRRADTETASPVQVLTAEDLARSGYTSIAEVMRDVTSNGQGLLSQGFNGAFAGGASGVALRGLTVGATLILVDGRRMVGYPLADDGQRNFVDVSSIPFSAVERVEILLDGASAIYGSDAIGGVVNFIMRKNFTGTRLMAQGGSTFQRL
jgi:iron complex outermembrane receptor protein